MYVTKPGADTYICFEQFVHSCTYVDNSLPFKKYQPYRQTEWQYYYVI